MTGGMIFGVDVHPDFQHGLDFALLYRQGYRYAAIKMTQGTGYRHNLSDDWVTAARTAGLLAGGYHWLDSSDGAAQARWFHKRIVECGGPTGMLIMLDAEDNGYGPHMTAWAREWKRLTNGHPFAIYTGAWWWTRTNGFNGAQLTPYLWHSSYLDADADTIPDDPAVFAGRIPPKWWTPGYGNWRTATFLQFSSRGDAGRLGNNVDLNATRLGMTELRALAGLGPIGSPGETGGAITPILEEEEDDMPLVFWQLPNGWVGCSNGSTRYGYATEDLLKEAMAAFGVTKLRKITPAQLGAYGVDVSSGVGGQLVLNDDQIAKLGLVIVGAVPTAQQIATAVADEDHQRSEK